MRKLYRYIVFILKTTYKNMIRHLGLSISASIAITITLSMISVFMLITSNLNHFTDYIEQQVTIRASIDTVVKEEERDQLQNDIEALSTVKDVVLSTGEEELESYRKQFQEDASLFDMYKGDANPIRDTFLIEVMEGKDLEATAETVRNMKGIVSAEYGGESTGNMISSFASIRKGSMIFTIFLVIVALFLIANKIKMSIYTRKQEIAIMRFVGASNWCIRSPMMLEGMFIGMFGSLIPILITCIGYPRICEALGGTFMSSMFVLLDTNPLTLHVSAVLALIGIIVGGLGSFFATTRYLHWKR